MRWINQPCKYWLSTGIFKYLANINEIDIQLNFGRSSKRSFNQDLLTEALAVWWFQLLWTSAHHWRHCVWPPTETKNLYLYVNGTLKGMEVLPMMCLGLSLRLHVYQRGGLGIGWWHWEESICEGTIQSSTCFKWVAVTFWAGCHVSSRFTRPWWFKLRIYKSIHFIGFLFSTVWLAFGSIMNCFGGTWIAFPF